MRSGAIKQFANAYELINSFENPHVDHKAELAELADPLCAEDEVVDARNEPDGREGPLQPDYCSNKDNDEKPSRAQPEDLYKERYAVPRGKKRCQDEGNANQGGAEAKWQAAIDAGKALMEGLPPPDSPWEDKRAFAASMASFMASCELSPRYTKDNKRYVTMRTRHQPGSTRKEEVLQKEAAAQAALGQAA